MPSMHDAAFCEKLKALWLQTDPQLSCLEIGARLGLTVGQIVGLVRRRRWPNRPKAMPPRRVPEAAMPVPKPPPPVQPASKPTPPPPATCCFPLWGNVPPPKPALFCGAKVIPGLSYCPLHARVCFIHPSKYKAGDVTIYALRRGSL